MDVIQPSAAKVLILKLGGGGGRQAGSETRQEKPEVHGSVPRGRQEAIFPKLNIC